MLRGVLQLTATVDGAVKESQRNRGAPGVSAAVGRFLLPLSQQKGWAGRAHRGFGMFLGLGELPEACRGLLVNKGGQQVIGVREELYFFRVFPQEAKSSSELGKRRQLLLLSGTLRFRDIQEVCDS